MALNARGNLPVKPERAKPPELGVYPARDATLVERIITLQSTPGPFSSANMDAIIEICRRMTVMRVEAGHTFFNIGEPSSFSIRINYGHLRCTAESGEHVDVGAGMVLGALDAWAGGRARTRAPRPAVRWRTPVELPRRARDARARLSPLGLAAGLIAGG
jgi:hypothetical protein